MSVKLLTDHNLEFLSLKGGFTGSSESTLVKMPHCWKSHVAAHFIFQQRAAFLSHHKDSPLVAHMCKQLDMALEPLQLIVVHLVFI